MSRSTNDDLGPATVIPAPNAPIPVGTVIGHWDCPCCDRVIEVVHRAGRPRVYCSNACKQRAYRWRQDHGARTSSVRWWPAESAMVSGGKAHHALRTDRDPLSRRRDHRGREVTACGVLAEPKRPGRDRSGRAGEPATHSHLAPFLAGTPSTCRSCEALTQPRPFGLVPPGATPPPRKRDRDDVSSFVALHAISRDYPLDPMIRHLLDTAWAA